jgi:hypothetical protein
VASGDDEKHQPIGGLIGGLAGLIVLVFGTIGRVVLTLLVGSRIAGETENRQVVMGGLICGVVVGVTIGLLGKTDVSIWWFPAMLFGSAPEWADSH